MKSSARTDPPLVSAASLAIALSITGRAVRNRLARIKPAGKVFTRGQPSHAWTVQQLPADVHDELSEAARRGCYRNIEHLLADPERGWKPSIEGQSVTLAEVAEHCLSEATRLQRALLPTLGRLSAAPTLTAGETEARGLADYKAEFGHTISAAHWHRLVNRSLERAGTRTEYPVELFLPEKLARRRTDAKASQAPYAAVMHDLCRAFSIVQKTTSPTTQEKAHVWDVAFTELASLVEAGTDGKKARRLVFRALADSGLRLAKSTAALEMAFSRNLARWQAGACKPSALLDRRVGPRDDARLTLPESDRIAIIGHSVGAGGRVAQGFREALEAGKLSTETTSRMTSWPASKSYVPRRIRDAVRHDVAALRDVHHGPRQAVLNGAWIPRDYGDIGPGDVFQADDVTMPIAYWEKTPAGPAAMRGQLLLFVDVATSLILGFVLHSERNYKASIIRSGLLCVHDSWGLPRMGVYFENGIWKRSRLLVGRPKDEITLEETEMGLREFVRFRHAKLPRAKIVENIIGKLQNLVEPEVGYLGRNEQVEKFERIQKQLLQAGRGKIPHSSFLYSKAEWAEKLTGYCRHYNFERQDGRLHGLSPAEAYESGFNYQNPMVRLDGSARYLLANHCRQERVSSNGIRIVWDGQPFYYRSGDTSRLRGKTVLVFFDVESRPESITITDLDRRHPLEIPRQVPLPSYTAASEDIASAQAQALAHGSYQKTLYRAIQPHLKGPMFRQTQADASTVRLGEAIQEGRARVRIAQDSDEKLAQRTAHLERTLGVRPGRPGRSANARLRSLELLKQAEEMEAREENAS